MIIFLQKLLTRAFHFVIMITHQKNDCICTAEYSKDVMKRRLKIYAGKNVKEFCYG